MKQHLRTIGILIAVTLVVFLGVGVFYRTLQTRMARYAVRPKAIAGGTAKKTVPPAQVAQPIPGARAKTAVSIPVPPGPRQSIQPAFDKGAILRRLALRGTAHGGPKRAMAVIEDRKTRQQGLYRVGDPVLGGVVREIRKDRVLLRFNGRDINLEIAGNNGRESAGPTEDGGTVAIPRSLIEQALQNPKQVMNQVGIRPVTSAGGQGGVEIRSVAPGSIFERMGLQAGDIIHEINGTPIRHPDRLVSLYKGLSTALPNVTFERLDPELGGALLGLDPDAGGVAKEASKVYRKIESRQGISILISRGGEPKKLTFRFK